MTNTYTRIKKKQDSIKAKDPMNIIRADKRTRRRIHRLLNL